VNFKDYEFPEAKFCEVEPKMCDLEARRILVPGLVFIREVSFGSRALKLSLFVLALFVW